MVERDAEVLGWSEGRLQLRALGSSCQGCSGCGGRCGLFDGPEASVLTLDLPSPEHAPWRAGERVRVSLDGTALRHAAVRGYGWPLLGLILGGGAGHGVALLAEWPSDPAALGGALLGTLLAFGVSKRARATLQPQVHRR